MGEKIWNFIYKWWPLYNKSPVLEKDLKQKTLDELILMKESERDFLTINIPIVIGIFGVMFSLDDLLRKLCMLVLLVIFTVNIGVAHEEKKENIKIYNRVILKKIKKQKKAEEKYNKEIIDYLKTIAKN